jgi:hypothetical protein
MGAASRWTRCRSRARWCLHYAPHRITCASTLCGACGAQRALGPLLGYLRGLGVAPEPPPAGCTAAETLAGDSRRYLVTERGLADATVRAYLATARLFLGQLDQPGGLDLGKLTAGQVKSFAVGQCG